MAIIFNDLEKLDTTVVEVDGDKRLADIVSATYKKNGKLKAVDMQEILQDFLQKNPDILKTLGSRSKDVIIKQTLAYSDTGGIEHRRSSLDGKKIIEGKGSVVPTSKIVGYLLQNVGKEPLDYVTEYWHPVEKKDKKGNVWVEYESEGKVKETAQPGDTFMLTKAYTTILGVLPEYNLSFGNGKLVKGSRKLDEDKIDKNAITEEFIASFHFVFYPKEKKSVHDDDVKLQIGEKITTTEGVRWKVKEKYERVFGKLNNLMAKKVVNKDVTILTPSQSAGLVLLDMMEKQGDFFI